MSELGGLSALSFSLIRNKSYLFLIYSLFSLTPISKESSIDSALLGDSSPTFFILSNSSK